MRLKVRQCFLYRLLLFVPQLIWNHLILIICSDNTMILRKIHKISTSYIRLDLKPLCARLTRNAQLLQIGMKIFICKRAEWFCHICSTQMPPCLMIHANRVRLLIDTRLHVSLRKSNFCPSLMHRYSGSGIGITLRNNFRRGTDLDPSHYAISFTCVSMKSISLSSRPYFL